MYLPISCSLQLQILIAILTGWAVCWIMTEAGAFTDDKRNVEYKSRTDAKSDVIENSEWFYFPYPGKNLDIFL